jgi:hypothetical protein
MAHTLEALTTVKGGFPVLVRGVIYAAEPDVGYMNDWIEDVEIFTTTGKPAPWLKLSQKDLDTAEQALWDALERRSY